MARAIVIGGGIAGPVTAMALQRIGYEPTIYEAFNRTADGVGAFMNIAPNGLDALDCQARPGSQHGGSTGGSGTGG